MNFKKEMMNLLRLHFEKDEQGFRNKAREICNYFHRNGEEQLGEYIVGLLYPECTWTTQDDVIN